MKKTLQALLIVILFASKVSGQITITSTDLASAGDTFLVSLTQSLSGGSLTTTGPSSTWDFSNLTATSQNIDSFLNVASTNFAFAAFFIDLSFNTNRANIATRGTSVNLGTLNINDVFNFYYKSTTLYQQSGIGATISGIPLPIGYSPKDILYHFPIHYADMDTSHSAYQVDLTSTLGLYYSVDRMRYNHIDGWGSLITPYGTFDALRVKSTIVEQDSVYIDSLGFGLNLPAITTIEYKWWGMGIGIPLLQVNTNQFGIVSQVRFRDTHRQIIGVGSVNAIKPELKLYPNPTHGKATLEYVLPHSGPVSVDVFTIDGKQISLTKDEYQSAGKHVQYFTQGIQDFASGTYLIRFTFDGLMSLEKMVVE